MKVSISRTLEIIGRSAVFSTVASGVEKSLELNISCSEKGDNLVCKLSIKEDTLPGDPASFPACSDSTKGAGTPPRFPGLELEPNS